MKNSFEVAQKSPDIGGSGGKQESKFSPGKYREFLKVREKDISSADPESGEENWGSAIVMTLVIKNGMSKDKIIKHLVAGHIDAYEENKPSAKEIQMVHNRIEKTVDNLLKSKTILEVDGVLALNLG